MIKGMPMKRLYSKLLAHNVIWQMLYPKHKDKILMKIQEK